MSLRRSGLLARTGRFPMLRVKLFDAAAKLAEKIEPAAA
jgi:hypothetical protein